MRQQDGKRSLMSLLQKSVLGALGRVSLPEAAGEGRSVGGT